MNVQLSRYATTRREDGWHVVDTRTGESLEVFAASSSGAAAATTRAAELSHASNGAAPGEFELRAWRKARGLTLKSLAGKLGVTWLTVQRWESGAQSYPPYLTLALWYLEEHP